MIYYILYIIYYISYIIYNILYMCLCMLYTSLHRDNDDIPRYKPYWILGDRHSKPPSHQGSPHPTASCQNPRMAHREAPGWKPGAINDQRNVNL